MKTPSFEGYNIPGHTQASLTRYLENGYMPGGFLTAVMTNDLYRAVSSADEANTRALADIARWVFMNVPAGALFTEERMMEWCCKTQAANAEQEGK